MARLSKLSRGGGVAPSAAAVAALGSRRRFIGGCGSSLFGGRCVGLAASPAGLPQSKSCKPNETATDQREDEPRPLGSQMRWSAIAEASKMSPPTTSVDQFVMFP